MAKVLRSVVASLCSIVVLAISSAPASATYPGANGEIAYARYGGKLVPSTLRTIEPDGTGGRPLARPGVGLPDAQWSPDGTKLAMILGKEPNRIVMLDIATDDRTLVMRSDDVPGTRFIHSLGISPAGDEIVFCAVPRGSGATSLYTVGVDGSGAHRDLGQPGGVPARLGPDRSHRGRGFRVRLEDRHDGSRRVEPRRGDQGPRRRSGRDLLVAELVA